MNIKRIKWGSSYNGWFLIDRYPVAFLGSKKWAVGMRQEDEWNNYPSCKSNKLEVLLLTGKSVDEILRVGRSMGPKDIWKTLK